MVIDCHTHIFSPRIRDNRQEYIQRDPIFAELYGSEKAKLATAEELIADMDKYQIEQSVILNLGWTTNELCCETNDYILESVARYPKRLISFCAVQPANPNEAIKELERCAAAGARGVGELRPDTQGANFSDEVMMAPFAQALVKHNLVLLIHASEPVGHQYPGKGAATPDKLYPFILHHPEVRLICAHWGGGLPFYALMPEVKEALQNVYVDTAATPYLYHPRIFEHAASILGADKILFGTDYPLLRQRRVISQVMVTDLSMEEKMLIMAGNAGRLFGISTTMEMKHPHSRN